MAMLPEAIISPNPIRDALVHEYGTNRDISVGRYQRLPHGNRDQKLTLHRDLSPQPEYLEWHRHLDWTTHEATPCLQINQSGT